MKLRRSTFFLVLLLIAQTCFAQKSGALIEGVLERFYSREQMQPSGRLFLHTDKTLYTNNETIWFAAYLLQSRGVPLERHHTLSVVLQQIGNGKIRHSELYVMGGGLSSGSILLSDSIPAGSYRLFGYTNIVGKDGTPFEVFNQPLTIKSTLETKFLVSSILLDTASKSLATRRILVRASGMPVNKRGQYPAATVRYQIAAGVERSIQTDGNGDAIITYNADTLSASNHSLSASVNYNGEARHFLLPLPLRNQKRISIKFYPEGGQMVTGLQCLVGFQARTAMGSPLALRAVLLRDGKPIDTVECLSSGMGSFLLKPIAGSSYALKVDRGRLLEVDTTIQLPDARADLPVISIKSAIASDTLDFTIYSSKLKKYHVLLHNTHELLASFTVGVSPAGRQVKIALKDVPKGIAAVTVLDTLGRPMAERLFFAHYTDSELVGATTDRPIYKPREKVTLKLRLKPTAAVEEKALVSVAAVQGNRIEVAKFRDMESYSYLESELGSLPLSTGGRPYHDRQYLENLLLVKGWRKFTWDVDKWPAAVDTSGLYRSLEIIGKVTKKGKGLTEALTVTVLRDTLFDLIESDRTGRLNFRPENLILTYGKQIIISVNKNDNKLYDIDIENNFEITNNRLSSKMPDVGDNVTLNYNLGFNSHSGGMRLKEVMIKGKRDNSMYGMGGHRIKNDCGDYVCIVGILNCPNHPASFSSRAPIVGNTYRSLKIMGKVYLESTMKYTGCQTEDSNVKLIRMKGRQFAREFYVNDFMIDTETSYQSTVYWSPLVELSSSKDTELSFYTSDLKAPYRIVVQGMGEYQVVTGSTTFKVE